MNDKVAIGDEGTKKFDDQVVRGQTPEEVEAQKQG